jgi:hypothetical protein
MDCLNGTDQLPVYRVVSNPRSTLLPSAHYVGIDLLQNEDIRCGGPGGCEELAALLVSQVCRISFERTSRSRFGRPIHRCDAYLVRGRQPASPVVLAVRVSPCSTVVPEMVRPPPAARVIWIRRGWVFGEAGMVRCRTPSA